MGYRPERAEPRQLVDNRVSFAGPNAELSIYDTYEPAKQVALCSNHVLYCGMLTGRKIMRGATPVPHAFVPGESFVLAPRQTVWIDFPRARHDRPTTSMTVEIRLRPDRIDDVCRRLDQNLSRERALPSWRTQPNAVHVKHGLATQRLIERLVALYIDGHPDRQTLIDLALTELTVRMLRGQSRELLLASRCRDRPRHGIDAALVWIDTHLAEPLDIEKLARWACISRASLYRQFQRELGVTPRAYQQRMRLEQAKQRLSTIDETISAICFDLGFASLSHFIHRFKDYTGQTPGRYRARYGRASDPS